MAGWRILGLCVALAFPVGSLSRRQCERREHPDWSNFQTAIERSGLAGEHGMSNLAADLRTGALSLSVPHTYAIVGGGEWGPRVVAKALLESVYVDWVDDVYLLDMEEGKSYLRPDNGFDKAQTWFNEHLCRAIERCPRKAVVVLDNVHVLEGEEIRLLDKMLSLTDGEKTNMDCDDHKVSAERCLFLMLLNEDGLEENIRKSGKDRLTAAWEFKGPAFTTQAFVGRIDIAVSLSQKPKVVPAEMRDAWERARLFPADGWSEKVRKQAKAVWEATDRGTLQAIGVAAAATLLAACLKLGCFPAVFPRNAGEPRGAAGTAKVNVGTGSAGDGPGGDGDEKDGGNGDKKDKVGRRKALGTRGGGPVGGTPVDVGLQEDQEEEEKARGDGLLHGASEDETRSADDEACPAPPAPPPAEPLEGSAPPAAVAITGTIGGPGHHDGARQEAVAKRTRARVSVGQASKSGGSPPRNARRRRSTSKAAGNGEGAA